MAETVPPELERECRALSRYLVGREPSAYVAERYAHGLSSAAFRADMRWSAADSVLLRAIRTGRIGIALADTWSRFASPAGPFRRRVVLLGAILESAPDTFASFEPPPAGRLRAWSILVGTGLLFGVRLIAATLVIGPLHLAARLSGGGNGRP